MYLWTEKGALLHAKSLNTDKAWEVYDYLVDFYFRAQEAPRQQASVPKGKMVVDIPENAKAQDMIKDMHQKAAAMEAMLKLYDRYQPEESFQKIAYAVCQLEMSIADAAYTLSVHKPHQRKRVIT